MTRPRYASREPRRAGLETRAAFSVGEADIREISPAWKGFCQIERIIEVALQCQKPCEQLFFPAGLLRVAREVVHFLRIGGDVIQPGNFRLGIEDQLPATLGNGALQFEISAVNGR